MTGAIYSVIAAIFMAKSAMLLLACLGMFILALMVLYIQKPRVALLLKVLLITWSLMIVFVPHLIHTH